MSISDSITRLIISYIPEIYEEEIGGWYYASATDYMFGPFDTEKLANADMVIYYWRLTGSALLREH